MPSQATVTARTGPALQNTAIVLSDVSAINMNLNGRLVQIYQNGVNPIKEFDLSTVTTMTVAISGSNFTVVIS